MNERLKQFIDYLVISTRQFEEKISSSDGKIAKFLANNTSLKSDTLVKIMEIFPQLSIEWLLIGKGEMIRQDEPASPMHDTDGEIEALKKTISVLEQNNADLRAHIEDLRVLFNSKTPEK